MSWNSRKPLLAMLVLFMLTGSSLAQVSDDRTPKSILDYYFLLPHKHLAYLKADSRSVREAAIKIKDLDGGFLKSGLEADEVYTSLALLKKSDGSDLIAVENRSCPSGCSSNVKLLLYAYNQWTDVTHDLLPAIDEGKIDALMQGKYVMPSKERMGPSKFIYTLRKNGTIEVNEHWTGMVLGEFEWVNDAFVFKPEEAVRSNYRVLAETDNPQGDRLQIIGIDPEPPATLPLDGHLRIRIAYNLKSGKHGFIWATPVVLEQRLPDTFTSGSMPYKPGSGVTTVYLGFNNEAHLNLLRVTMVDDQRKPILTLTYPIDANWKGKRACPVFRLNCFPDRNSSGASLACMVYPSGVLPGQEFTYQWSVSAASIVTGQGTRRITLIPSRAETEEFKVELDIGNLPGNCERKASFTGMIGPKE